MEDDDAEYPAAGGTGTEVRSQTPDIVNRDGSVKVAVQSRLGEYDVVKPIGKGKFSTVFRATRISDGIVVALKKIRIFDAMDEKSREKCLKEISLVRALDHPNIIKFFDSFVEANELHLVFEYAEAGDLKRQLRKAQEREARFDERVIWKYFSQIAEAIRHMHERRVMHRDLKPANVFLTLTGTVKVGDLGLGRSFSDATAEAFSKVGTPLYMSPEVLKGEGYEWKSDVWSLGCMLYELAMLRSPFKEEGLNLYGLFRKITKGEYPPISPVYSQGLRDLVARMLSINPAERPDMNEVCEVAQAMRESTTRQRPSSEPGGARPPESTPPATVPDSSPNRPRPVSQPASAAPEPGPPPADAHWTASPPLLAAQAPAGGTSPPPTLQRTASSSSASSQPAARGTAVAPAPAAGPASPTAPSAGAHTGPSSPAAEGNGSGSPGARPYVPQLRFGGRVQGSAAPGPAPAPAAAPQVATTNHALPPTGSVGSSRPSSTSAPGAPATHHQPDRQRAPSAGGPARPLSRNSDGGDDDMMDGEPADVPRTRSQLMQSNMSSTDAMIACDQAIERLKLLNYEREFLLPTDRTPFCKMHFVCVLSSPATASDREAKWRLTPFQQYKDFVAICEWLLKIIMGPAAEDVNLRQSNPIFVATTLLNTLERLGCPQDVIVNTTPHQLSSGNGLAACRVLDWLTEKALTCRGWTWETVEYVDDGDELEEDVGDDALEVDAALHASADEEEMLYADQVAAESATHAMPARLTDTLPRVDPTLWAAELERVRLRLVGFDSTERTLGAAWRDHLAAAQKHSKTLQTVLKGQPGVSSPTDTSMHTTVALEKLGADCAATVERILRSESRVNTMFQQQRDEFQACAKQQEELQVLVSRHQEAVNEAATALADVTDASERVQEALNERGGNLSNTEPLQQIRSAVAKLREEIQSMELRIGTIRFTVERNRLAASATGGKRPVSEFTVDPSPDGEDDL